MIVMRHGQSTFNAAYDTTGRDPDLPDPPLTDRGRREVEKAAQQLSGTPVDLILCSPYTRAVQSALILANQLRAPVQIEPLVGERRLYSCDIGRPRADLSRTWPDLDFSGIGDGVWWDPFPENPRSFNARIEQFRDKWADQDRDRRLLTVSHWYVVHALTGADAFNAEIVRCRL